VAEVILNKLRKEFKKGQVIVKDIDLKIEDKEFMVFVGPSGCGKTTTLRMIAGLEEVTSGDIYIGGKRVNEVSPKDRDIAMVFQNYALYPHMSVYENMAFGLKLRKLPKEEIDRRVKEAARLLDIEHLLDRKPRELSGGQRQRVAMGRAIVREPQLFLMDEPLSNLDAKLRVQMRAELQKLHHRLGVTTIYVTHDQTEAMTLGQKIAVMNAGVVQQVGTPLELYEKPANKFVASFIGSPSMNFIEVTVITDEKGDFFLFNEGLKLKVPQKFVEKLSPYLNKVVILGIRPEDIYDTTSSSYPQSVELQKAIIEVMEPMGAEVYLYFNIIGNSMIARVDAHTQAKIGAELTLAFDMEKIHIFNKETEKAIL